LITPALDRLLGILDRETFQSFQFFVRHGYPPKRCVSILRLYWSRFQKGVRTSRITGPDPFLKPGLVRLRLLRLGSPDLLFLWFLKRRHADAVAAFAAHFVARD